MVSDVILLQRYARTRDAEAFTELVRRYAGLVYGTCLRVLQNTEDAEDVTQECFIELARKAGNITSSLPGWLHALARSRAIDAIRKASARRHYEEQAMADGHDEGASAWADIAPYVDEALVALPEEVRLPLLLHFFEGRTQGQVAQALGVNQSTVSRRIEKGLETLRAHLQQAGVVVSVAVLAALLTTHAVTAAPATLVAALSKMALAGVGCATTGATVPIVIQLTQTIAGKLLLGVLAGALLVTGAFVVKQALGRKAHGLPPAVAGMMSLPATTNTVSGDLQPAPLSATVLPTVHPAATAPRKELRMAQDSPPAAAKPAVAVTPHADAGVDAVTHLSDKLVQLAAQQFADDLPKKSILFAGVPMAYTQALNAAGTKISFAEFTALTGWAFSFGYRYDDISPAFMALRGQPGGDGPFEVFQALPERLGFTREITPVKNDETFWNFICTHINADIPVLSEHMDGGIICGYRQQAGVREVWFVGGPLNGWVRVDKLQPFEVCALKPVNPAVARRQLYREALAHAVELANRPAPQGLAALTAFLQDVGDERKDFAKGADWFSWAAFERLSARKCCAVWLRAAAEEFGGLARDPLLAAAQHYDNAFIAYDSFRLATAEDGKANLHERARTPEKIAAIVPLLKRGIDEERAAVAEMEKALPLIPVEPVPLVADHGAIPLSAIHLLGDGYEQDSFCLALQEASRLLGHTVSYESLLALSTNAFAPGFDIGNDCKELWVCQGWVSHRGPAQAAWQQLGLSVTPITFSRPQGDLTDPNVKRAYRLACAQQIRAEMDAGKVVITSGGWATDNGKVEPWWAGIITEVSLNGAVRGAHPNGKTHNELTDITQGEVFAVSLTQPTLDDPQINRELLQAAINRIRAQGKDFAKGEYSAFGVDALDEWIGQMQHETGFCPECMRKTGSGMSSAMKVARAMSHRSDIAARYLNARLTTFPAAAQPIIKQAAAHYERIVAMLQPAIVGKGEESYRQIVGNLGKQQAHAKQVLLPVKAELVAVAAEMEKALPLITGKAKILDGVATLGWGRDKEDTFAGALESTLAAVKTPWSYTDLMGVSALSFRVRWYQGTQGQRWCPSSPVGEFPEERDALQQATGWQLHATFIPNGMNAQMARFVPQIVANIDAGKPVPAYPPNANMGVIYGYEDDGNMLLLRDYDKPDAPLRLPATQLGQMVIFLGDHGQPLPQRAALLNALQHAVRNWRRVPDPRNDTPGKSGAYQYGQGALTAWADDLGKTDQLTDEERGLLFFVSWWNFDGLYDARKSAITYLENHADILSEQGQTALKQAADLYRQELGMLSTVFADHDAFFGPWSGKSIKEWTPEVRKREQTLLRQAADIETAATAEMEKAVAAEGIKPPVVLTKAISLYNQVNDETRAYPQRRSEAASRVVHLRSLIIGDVDYETLIMLWGFGTSFAYHPKKYFAMYIEPENQEVTERRIARRFGRAWEYLPQPKSAEEAWTTLKASIDGGQPIAGHYYDELIFLGYQDAERSEDRKVLITGLGDDTSWWSWAEFTQWTKETRGFRRPGEVVARAPERELAIEVMKQIVTFPEHDGRAKLDFLKDAHFGLDGMVAYAADIEDMTKTTDYFDAGWIGCHCIYRQFTGRKCAAIYLTRIAELFPPAVSAHILAAAKEYEAAYAAWGEWEQALGQTPERNTYSEVPSLWKIPANRKAGAAAIRKAAVHEQAAAEEIGQALAALGVG